MLKITEFVYKNIHSILLMYYAEKYFDFECIEYALLHSYYPLFEKCWNFYLTPGLNLTNSQNGYQIIYIKTR
jgi:hypothetical protein